MNFKMEYADKLIYGTPEKYKAFLINALEANFVFLPVKEYANDIEKKIILRHDVDFSLDFALQMAIMEKSLNIKSTYYVMISGDFYNILDTKSIEVLNKIKLLGHEIGLHFSSKTFLTENYSEELSRQIAILSNIVSEDLFSYSQHDPTKDGLKDIVLSSYINAYDLLNMDCKYVSDSGMMWYETNFEDSIKLYDKLYILAHPITWFSAYPSDMLRILDDIKQKEVNRISSNYEKFMHEQVSYWETRINAKKYYIEGKQYDFIK